MEALFQCRIGIWKNLSNARPKPRISYQKSARLWQRVPRVRSVPEPSIIHFGASSQDDKFRIAVENMLNSIDVVWLNSTRKSAQTAEN